VRNKKILAGVLLLVFSGCGLPPVEERPLVNLALAKKLRTRADGLYPESFRMLHRVVLTVRGRQFDFTGYVLIKRPDQLRVVAFSELGGTLFDVLSRSPGQVQMMRKPAGIKPQWLARFMVETVRMLYCFKPGPTSRLTGGEDEGIALSAPVEEGGYAIVFDKKSQQVTGFAQIRDGRYLRRARCLASTRFETWPVSIPSRIRVEDYAGNYCLEITVLSLKPERLPLHFFSVENKE
jgi:hypothetical protein